MLFAALAIYLDPTRPAGFLAEAHLLLASYIAFSLWLALTPPPGGKNYLPTRPECDQLP